jgi:hypothetical protein
MRDEGWREKTKVLRRTGNTRFILYGIFGNVLFSHYDGFRRKLSSINADGSELI